jgi:hypothetical protein
VAARDERCLQAQAMFTSLRAHVLARKKIPVCALPRAACNRCMAPVPEEQVSTRTYGGLDI